MRTTKDIYKLSNGKLVAINQATKPPEGSKLFSGYDYENQYWVFEGKKDVRTLEELKRASA